MDASARRIKAERDRNRLPRRAPASRWTRRIAGLLATAAFLGVGFASVQMITPDQQAVEEAPAATATTAPTPKAKKAAHKSKPKGLTKAQRAARADAVADVRRQGFTTLKTTDYDPKAKLRVLIARPVGDAAGGHLAFFFTRDGFLAKDAPTPSTDVRVAKQGKSTIMLSYGVYKAGDAPGSPSGRKRVRFQLVDGALQVLDTVPTPIERFQRRTG